jgi:hypothetical protein
MNRYALAQALTLVGVVHHARPGKIDIRASVAQTY